MTGERKAHLDRRAVALVVGCTVLWGFGQVTSKIALVQIPPLTQGGLRSLGAALLVLAWARWRGIPLRERDGSLVPGLVAGILFAAEFGALYSALQFTTAGRMTVFLYLAPFVVALGMAFISRAERLRGVGLVGLVVAFSGVAVAYLDSFGTSAGGSRQWLGDLLATLAAIGWGATTLVIRATRMGFHIVQIGVDYFPRSRGVSTLSSGPVIPKILREMRQLRTELDQIRPLSPRDA